VVADRRGRVIGRYVLNPPIDDRYFRRCERLHVGRFIRRHALKFSITDDMDRALPLQFGSHRHDGFGNGTPLFSDVCRARDRRTCQGIGARVREPQNFVEFRGAEPVALAGFPYDIMDKPSESILRGPPRAHSYRVCLRFAAKYSALVPYRAVSSTPSKGLALGS
jgi:hypothetical protein